MHRLVIMLGLLVGSCTANAVRSAETEEGAGDGEEKVTGAAADQALATLKAGFLERPRVRGRITTVMDDDLLGPREVRGQMVLQMPQRFLRHLGPAEKPTSVWLLDGAVLRESTNVQDTVNAKDFSQAPKKLALLKAALTMDADVLKEYFDLALFRKAGAGDDPTQWRLVLTPQEGAKNPIDYKRIEARWLDRAPFFSEIRRVPKEGKGDPLVERYTDLQVVERLGDGDFKSPLLENKEVKSDSVKD